MLPLCTACDILVASQDQVVSPYLGDNVTLTCVSRSPSASIWWQTSTSPNASTVQLGGTLRLAPVLAAHTSPYYCLASDSECSQWGRFVLRVQYDWGKTSYSDWGMTSYSD